MKRLVIVDGIDLLSPVVWCLFSTYLGFKFSLDTNDPSMMARMGSIIVIVGIYYTWKDLSKSRVLLKAQVDGWLKNKENDLSKSLETDISRLKTVDVFVLTYGTFIWGWGDLLMNLFLLS